MQALTRTLWASQDRHPGDRYRLFRSVADAVTATSGQIGAVLYPGSFVDVAASFVFRDVTYVDTDIRAKRFFADTDGVREIIDPHDPDGTHRFRFLHRDYRDPLDLANQSVDLLVSLYAGFVGEHCTRYLRPGGTLLVNPSHGDAALASIDARYQLAAVVLARSGSYRVDQNGLDRYLVPKREVEVTADLVHGIGRGVAYTRSPFAYLFRRIA